MIRLFLIMSVVAGMLLRIAAEQPIAPPLDGTVLAPARTDAAVTELMEAAHVTGVGIAIFRKRQVALLKAYGLRDTEKRLPLTPDSVMTSASLSKAAFATMVMGLVGEGMLDLDRPIYRYLPRPLPDYPRYADLQGDDRYKKLTLRILLSHRSGFANWRAFEPGRKLQIHFEPGARFAYSGEGIDLAQLVVETVAAKPLRVLMEERLYRPLHMARTSMVWEQRFEGDFANGYDEQGRSLGPQRRSVPDAAGSMQTTLRDYATFLSAVLEDRALNATLVSEMLRPQVRIHSARQFPSLNTGWTTANDAIALSYGIGWGLYSVPAGKAFFKEGHDDGWRHLALCFEDGNGMLILTNSSNGEGIFKPLLESVLGKTSFPFDWEGYPTYHFLSPLPKLTKTQ